MMFERAATGRLGSFPAPAFACGVGDQVYGLPILAVQEVLRLATESGLIGDEQETTSTPHFHEIADELRRRGVKVHDEIFRKPNAAVAIEGELLGQLSQVRGLLLSGVND